MKYTSKFWNTFAKPLTFSRVDSKNPNQSRNEYTDVGTTKGLVEVFRDTEATSDLGLDTLSSRYRVTIKNDTFGQSLRNKDSVEIDGTKLHIVHIRPLEGSVYLSLVCSDIDDPYSQRRR